MATIYIRSNSGRTVYITMSPDGDEVRTHDYLSIAELYCAVEYGAWEVCE